MARRIALDPRATARVHQLGTGRPDPQRRVGPADGGPRRALGTAAGPWVDPSEDLLLGDDGDGLGDDEDHSDDKDRGGSHDRVTPAERMSARRLFGRSQLAVVGCLVVLALLLAGWAVLRARPVALAEPVRAGSSSPVAPTAASSGSPSATAGGGSGAASTIEVHVLGAVRRPGLQRLSAGARVADALDAAGGMSGDASPGRLNLAQPVADGQQVYVARRGHSGSEVRDPESTTPAGGGGASSTGRPSGASKINLNEATAAQLDELPGIGPVTAGKIIDWRAQHGRFSRIEELQEVDGIGPKTYADLAPEVTV